MQQQDLQDFLVKMNDYWLQSKKNRREFYEETINHLGKDFSQEQSLDNLDYLLGALDDLKTIIKGRQSIINMDIPQQNRGGKK